MLDDLGLLGQKDFLDIRNEAYDESDARYDASKGAEDGHQDAMRHAYWNALMVGRFGLEWAERFATAHERTPAIRPTRRPWTCTTTRSGARSRSTVRTPARRNSQSS